MTNKAFNYASYLKVDELLSLQEPKSTEHDEVLFVIIHQVYELWFKQILHEVDYLAGLLMENDPMRALHTFRRVLTIMKTVVGQVDVIETMTPLEFNSFRDRLESASGFQSYQFRELEFALGHKRPSVMENFAEGSDARARIDARYAAPTLWDAFLHFLDANRFEVPKAHLNRDVTQPVKASAEIQALLVRVYKEAPRLARVCERMVDLDEGLMEWRYRHVKMVSRTIGMKKGTGGSSGVGYLSSTLHPLFEDLWSIRSEL